MLENQMTYEEKVKRLEAILSRLDNSDTPIDELASDVKEGATLIKELDKKLKAVENEVKDAFKELDGLNISKVDDSTQNKSNDIDF